MATFYVEYVDEHGDSQSEIWSRDVLNLELMRGEVHITYIDLAYSLQVKLGLA